MSKIDLDPLFDYQPEILPQHRKAFWFAVIFGVTIAFIGVSLLVLFLNWIYK